MKSSIDRMPVCDRKYYGIFAVNPRDPNDILGYVENSFSMGWSSKFVNVIPGYGKSKAEAVTDRWFAESSVADFDDKRFAQWFKSSIHGSCYVEGMTVAEMREKHREAILEMHENSFLAQKVWNSLLGHGFINAPVGYDVKKFRLGSKRCPVEVDLRYRTAWDRVLISHDHGDRLWDKWRYRNALFSVKALDLDKGKPLASIVPTVNDSLAVPGFQLDNIKTYKFIDKNAPAVVVAKHRNAGSVMSRSQKKILKKQRENSRKAASRQQS